MQQLNPSEISDIIKNRIQGLDVKAEAQNEGTIVGVADGIVRIHGLAQAQYGEMIQFDGGIYGMALNLERDSVGVVVLGDYQELTQEVHQVVHLIHELPIAVQNDRFDWFSGR